MKSMKGHVDHLTPDRRNAGHVSEAVTIYIAVKPKICV